VLIDWVQDQRNIDSFEWYQALYAYSYVQPADGSGDADEQELGPDGDLAVAMVSTALVQRIVKLLEAGAFDPYNAAHVRGLVDVVEAVEAAVESEAVKFHMLLKAALQPFRDEVERSVLLVRDTLSGNTRVGFDPQAPPARRRFLARRLKLVRNLSRWRKYTGERFGVGELVTRVLRECMIPVAEGGWEVGGTEIMAKAVAGLPAELVPAELRTKLR